jgi:hypothetical protein
MPIESILIRDRDPLILRGAGAGGEVRLYYYAIGTLSLANQKRTISFDGCACDTLGEL